MFRLLGFSTTVVAAFSIAFPFLPAALAQSSFSQPAVDSTSKDLNFALTIPANSSDLVFSLSGPASQSWIAVGTGSQMAGSMMFVIYSNANGQNVTLSPRIAPSHAEPKFSKNIDVSLLDGTGISNGLLQVKAHCRSCKGSLDFSSTTQPWIWAVGPAESLKSDSTSATISQHDIFGNFHMDMLKATAQSSSIAAPTADSTNSSTSSSSSETTGSTTSTGVLAIHAALSVLGYLVLMPLGVVILRFLDSVRWHWVTQVIASIIAIAGGVIGFAVVNSFYDSKKNAEGHKGFGIVVLIATGVQVLLGWWHHWNVKRKGHGTFFGIIHRYFGWVVMVAGIANAAVGLDLVVSTTGVIVYIVVAYIFLVAVFAAVIFIKWRKVRATKVSDIPLAAI